LIAGCGAADLIEDAPQQGSHLGIEHGALPIS
jgi:hypothetical protein